MENRRLRVGFVCHEYPPLGGGAATALEAVSGEVARMGHEVVVVTIGTGRTIERSVEAFGRTVVRLPAGRQLLLSPSIWELCRSYWVLRRLGEREMLLGGEVDGVIAYFAFPAGHAVISWRCCRRGLLVFFRGSDVPGFGRRRGWWLFNRLMPWLVKAVVRRSEVILANGRVLTEQVGSRVALGRRVINLPNGVMAAKFRPESDGERLRRADSGVGLLFVGQLIPRKRCLEMLEGVLGLDSPGLPVALTLVGDGPLRETIAGRLRACPSGHPVTVHLLGVQPREVMPEIYRRHHILLLLSHAEGVSNVLMEGLASGLVVVASDTAVDPEVAREILVVLPRVDAATIGRTLGELIANRERMEALGRAARQWALTRDWRNHAEALMRCLPPPCDPR